MDPYAELPDALGLVIDAGRGALPWQLIHGESLVACASWSLGEAGVRLLDFGTEWWVVQQAEEPLVLHDVACPMTPPAFFQQCLAESVAHDAVVVGVRPVTDTIKTLVDGFIGDNVDRDELLTVVSPAVLPASVIATIDDLPELDFTGLVGWLRQRVPVVFVEAPLEASRVHDPADLAVLEALTAST